MYPLFTYPRAGRSVRGEGRGLGLSSGNHVPTRVLSNPPAHTNPVPKAVASTRGLAFVPEDMSLTCAFINVATCLAILRSETGRNGPFLKDEETELGVLSSGAVC